MKLSLSHRKAIKKGVCDDVDFVRLVENGTYKKEDLSEKNLAFINGMEHVKNSVLENVFDGGDFDSFSPTFSKMQEEIAEEVVRLIKEWLHVVICETTVELLDMEEAERGE